MNMMNIPGVASFSEEERNARDTLLPANTPHTNIEFPTADSENRTSMHR